MIESVAIGTNKYGVKADDIRLYSYAGAENLTLGQLVNAVCCRAGMALESQAVAISNVSNLRTRRLSAAAKVLKVIADGGGYDDKVELGTYGTMTTRDFLRDVMGYTFVQGGNESADAEARRLPATIAGDNERLSVYAVMKSDLDEMSTESQRRMIDLQTCMSRRDVVYSCATNIVQTLGGVLQTTAANF